MNEAYVLFLLGVLQIIMIGIGSWTLLSVVSQGKEIIVLQTKFDAVMAGRVEVLETSCREIAKSVGELQGRVGAVEKLHLGCAARILQEK